MREFSIHYINQFFQKLLRRAIYKNGKTFKNAETPTLVKLFVPVDYLPLEFQCNTKLNKQRKQKNPAFKTKSSIWYKQYEIIKTHYKLLMHCEILTVTMILNNSSSMDYRWGNKLERVSKYI